MLQLLFYTINNIYHLHGNDNLYGSYEGVTQMQGSGNIGQRSTHHKDAFWIRFTSTSTVQHTTSMILANTVCMRCFSLHM